MKNQEQKREKIFAYWLSQVKGIGAVTAKKLFEYAGSFEAIYNMKKEEQERLDFLRSSVSVSLLAARRELDMRAREYEDLKKNGTDFILYGEAEYPERLKNIYDMPMWLFVKGKLPDDERPSVAVVGARSCTPYGRQEAEYIGKLLAENGVQVVSGLALGIDLAAHEGAVRARGDTYAVLGCGINLCYPETGRKLYEKLPETGGVISEYGPGILPLPAHFPVRNRIISGLSDMTVVVEARKRSGSLITADLAMEQGREVMALPGRRTDPLSAGCNRLIFQGAGIVTEPEDILDFFQIKCKNSLKKIRKSVNALAKAEKMVYSCLDSQPKHTEEIIRQCGLPYGECMTALLHLELDGWAVQPINQYYVRKLE